MKAHGRIWFPLTCVLALSLTAVACGNDKDAVGAASATNEIVDLTVGCAPSIAGLPREYAIAKGIDRDHGLDLSCVNAKNGPELSAMLISGDTDIAPMPTAGLFSLLEQDVDVVAFVPAFDRELGDLLVGRDVPLPNAHRGWAGVMRDLRTATIGVVVRGAGAEDLARGLFTEAGLDPDGPTYVATGAPNTTLAALSNGEVDAAVTFEPGITVALERGIAVQPFSVQELTGPPAMDWASLMYVATRDYAEQNTEALKRFALMWKDALDEFADPANRADVVAFVGDHFGLEPAEAERMVERNLPFFPTSLRLEPDRFDPVGDFYYDMGRFPKAYHVADYGFDVVE